MHQEYFGESFELISVPESPDAAINEDGDADVNGDH